MTDVFKSLPRMSFRGIEAPLSSRRVSFEHEQVRHKFAFRDNELVEAIGHHNWVFEYTVVLREGINKGPYRNLYTKVYADFVRACRDRSEGELIDPELGTFNVRPVSFEVNTDINRRDGEDAQVTFIHSPAQEDTEELADILAGVPAVVSEGRRLDDEIANVPSAVLEALGLDGATLDTGVDVLDQINGIGQQFISTGNRVAASLDRVAFKIEKIENTIDQINGQLSNPQNTPIARSAKRLRDSVLRLRAKAQNPGRKITSFIVRQDTPALVLASQFKMTPDQLLALNPKLPLPIVPANTSVFHFA